jgi:CRISPR-associated endoribonuclease Cas6
MAPFGHGAPVFPSARRQRGRYPAAGPGFVEFGSPLPEVVEALARGLSGTRVLDWGGVALVVDRVEAVEPPDFSGGQATFVAATPVVMKASGRDTTGARVSRQAWVLPGEPEWDVYFAGNLRRKAETLGLDAAVALESIERIGPKRSFVTGGSGLTPGAGNHVGKKVGAPVTVGVSGPPATLAAIWSWGIGQANSGGFGWVAA